MTPSTAWFIMLALVLSGCAATLTAKQTTDLAAFDACSTPGVAVQQDLRAEVLEALSEGYPLPIVVSGFEVAARARRVGSVNHTSEDVAQFSAHYLARLRRDSWRNPIVGALDYYPAIRRCLVARGYAFPPPLAPYQSIPLPWPTTGSFIQKPLTRAVACADEAKRAGADPIESYVEECIER